MPIPTGDMGAVSPDGKFLAYTPLGERFRQWKNYRGGTASRIWVLKLDDLSHEEIPKPAGGCNDTEPMWIGETVYFLSDRDGEFNLYSYDRRFEEGRRAAPTTTTSRSRAPRPARARSSTSRPAGFISSTRSERESRRLKIGVAADLAETRPRYATRRQAHPRTPDISPSGKRAVLEYRGEIVTVPAKKGDPRNLTQTPGAHERSPVWSPDGKSIAYFSDASGEYALVVRPQDGKGDGRSYPPQGGRLLRAAGLVARQQEDRLHRQLRGRSTGSTSPPAPSSGSPPSRSTARVRHSRTRTPGRPTRSGWPTRSPTGPASRRSGSIRSSRTSRTR